jgi:hypothetical protein
MLISHGSVSTISWLESIYGTFVEGYVDGLREESNKKTWAGVGPWFVNTYLRPRLFTSSTGWGSLSAVSALRKPSSM